MSLHSYVSNQLTVISGKFYLKKKRLFTQNVVVKANKKALFQIIKRTLEVDKGVAPVRDALSFQLNR